MSSSSPERRDWLALPREVTAAIISRLVAIEILTSAQLVCKSWHEVCKDPLVWLEINFYNIGGPLSPALYDYNLDRMCRRAVDRSSGQLVGIGISHFGHDDLIRYIVDRCSLIKTLRLGYCTLVSDKCLIEATARLPLLEELDLSHYSFKGESLESVGRSCPRLKSLALNFSAWRPDPFDANEDRNAEAMAIAKSMPELRYLQLIGNPMTIVGLKAILLGCPRLESLDLRLFEKIKCLRSPMEATSDLDWECGRDDDDDDDYYDYMAYSS